MHTHFPEQKHFLCIVSHRPTPELHRHMCTVLHIDGFVPKIPFCVLRSAFRVPQMQTIPSAPRCWFPSPLQLARSGLKNRCEGGGFSSSTASGPPSPLGKVWRETSPRPTRNLRRLLPLQHEIFSLFTLHSSLFTIHFSPPPYAGFVAVCAKRKTPTSRRDLPLCKGAHNSNPIFRQPHLMSDV